MKPVAALWRLGVSLVVSAVLLILIMNVIIHPIAEDTRTYTAEFTDASGLHTDADVRVRGVRVGKVKSIELTRRAGQSVAAVRFTLDKRYGVVPLSRLAIKFQALTGVRYVDVTDAAEGYKSNELVTKIPTSMTHPSFDITALFNGLQPVLATLNPDEINTLTANVASFLSGDDNGLSPLLESLRRLGSLVADRQEVVSRLVHNLAEVSETMDAGSPQVLHMLDELEEGPIPHIFNVLDEFRKSQVYGEFTLQVVRLLNNAGLVKGQRLDTSVDRAYANLDNLIDAFKLTPVMWDNAPIPVDDGAPEPCSRGRMQLPETMDVLLNDRRVVLCNPTGQ